MRGYRLVSFKQFSEHCKFQKAPHSAKLLPICDDNSFYSGCACCASFCTRWRRINRANIKVAKVTCIQQRKG